MEKVNSVLDFANGAMLERVNYELVKVMENIKNPNTDDKPRKITIELSITPVNDRNSVTIKSIVKKTLRPTSSVQTQMAVQTMDNKIGCYELTGIPDGQLDLYGEVHKTKFIEINREKEEV